LAEIGGDGLGEGVGRTHGSCEVVSIPTRLAEIYSRTEDTGCSSKARDNSHSSNILAGQCISNGGEQSTESAHNQGCLRCYGYGILGMIEAFVFFVRRHSWQLNGSSLWCSGLRLEKTLNGCMCGMVGVSIELVCGALNGLANRAFFSAAQFTWRSTTPSRTGDIWGPSVALDFIEA